MASTEHRSTLRVLEILELISRSKDGYTLAELSRLLNAPKSSLFPIVHTMENRHFLLLNASTGQYHIGQNTYFVGSAYESAHSSFDFIRSCMKQLVQACGETCHLGILSGNSILYVAKTEADNPITLRSHVGQTLPAYCTGIGKALICDCTRKELEALYPDGLASYTPTTITSMDTLFQTLQEVRRTGFAYEFSELTEGILCIAVSLRNKNKIIAAVSVCIPAYRATEEKKAQTRALLKKLKIMAEQNLDEFHITDAASLL
ncbi:MAG: IclR family transcriptional regulator [Lachnospiraceae bacterium]|nr:IclR family transcriptional regulator [Lachnospiraceae bacterium]